MVRIVTSLTLRFRRRWLGVAFIRLTTVLISFGWTPGPRTMNALADTAYHLMGPTIVEG